MKLTYLGTAAAEGFPALFCNCPHCQEARRLGGKNIRTRSQAMVNEDLLIDMPADTYSHFLQNGIEGDRIRYLLITHSHSDHCYPNDLWLRGDAYAHDMRTDALQIYAAEGAYRRLQEKADSLLNVHVAVIQPFETVTLGAYTVTALPARHMPGDHACFYIIRGEKTILYAHDTGYFYEEVFTYLESEKLTFDLVSFDCTYVDLPVDDEGHHMGFDNIARIIARLTAMGAVTDQTKKIVNHFSHNGNPLHHALTERAAQIGCEASYDGMVVEV